MKKKQSWFKYALGIVICLLFRLIPGRGPNLEPIMATSMPFSKQYGYIAGFLFPLFSVVLFDLITGMVGIWTLITSIAYGLVGLGAVLFFRRFGGNIRTYFTYSILGTIAFDALTGLTIGPIFYGQPFIQAFTGQIPFTLMHLLGNSVLSVTVSPIISKFLVENFALEPKFFLKKVFFFA